MDISGKAIFHEGHHLKAEVSRDIPTCHIMFVYAVDLVRYNGILTLVIMDYVLSVILM